MRAGLRLTTMLLTGGLWLAPVAALAQSTTAPPPSTTAPSDAIGPRELQNFSLPGSTTRPAEQAAPATTPPQRPSSRPSALAAQAPTPVPQRTAAQDHPAARPSAP